MARCDLLFVDIDGTLHGVNGVHPDVWPAVEAARAEGLKMAICTGRPCSGVALEFARRLDPEGLHIFEAGVVVARADGRPVHIDGLPEGAFATVLELGRAHGVVVEAFTAAGRYVVAERNALVRAHEEILETQAIEADLDALAEGADPVIRAQWLIPEHGPALAPLNAAIAERPELTVHLGRSPTMGEILFTGITGAGVSKASAARWVAEQQGSAADLSRAAMVGDGLNDLELIQAVGLPLAMANAEPAVKAAAARVMPSVDEGGVVQAIAWALGRPA